MVTSFASKLYDDRGQAYAEIDALMAKAEGQGRKLTSSESARWDQLQATIHKLDDMIISEKIASAARIGGQSVLDRGTQGEGQGTSYAAMFGHSTDRGGFNSFQEFATALHSGFNHPSFQALMTPSDGYGTGLQIPGQFSQEIFDQSLEDEVVRPYARIEPMTSDTKTIAGIKHSDGTVGPFGITGGWIGAGGTIGEDNPPSVANQLSAKKLATLIRIANEAIADGGTLESQLMQALTKGLGWLLDSAFLTGSGAGMPLGVLNSDALITVSKETGQAATTIVYENIANMFARMYPAGIKRAVWVVNNTAIPQLLQLAVNVGTGGSHVPVMTESGGRFRMLTRPVVFTEKVPALGTLGDIMFCDFSQYAVGLRKELSLEKSSHLGFASDTAYYRGLVRADGMPMWSEPYTPKYGSTLSPFVTLAARA